jgi:ferredoxin
MRAGGQKGMTIFYFTSTGNSLAVAKKIGGTLISIPQVIGDPNPEYKDDIIGIIFPIYGWGMPKMVKKFCETARFDAEYMFAIGTYGNLPGACMLNAQKLAVRHGYKFDYVESLLMVDNYLPGFEVGSQIEKLPQKKTDENLARIIADIHARKTLTARATIPWRIMTALIKSGEHAFMKDTQAQSYIVNDSCTKCGTCAKICPSGNISVTGEVRFGDKCEWCLGCVHLCPENAIHLKNERSNARWRHPGVSLAEIIRANNREMA